MFSRSKSTSLRASGVSTSGGESRSGNDAVAVSLSFSRRYSSLLAGAPCLFTARRRDLLKIAASLCLFHAKRRDLTLKYGGPRASDTTNANAMRIRYVFR